MKRFVRHKATGTYLSRDGNWTVEPSAAQCFEDLQAILKLQRKLNLTQIEVVLQVGAHPSQEYDIALPLRDPVS